MNGAASLVKTLASAGVECSASPTRAPRDASRRGARPGREMCVLLFEGVATGVPTAMRAWRTGRLDPTSGARTAATGSPTCTTPGAPTRRWSTSSATSDLPRAVRCTAHLRRRGRRARPFSDWVRTSVDSRSVARDGAAVVAAAMAPPGRVATLIVPADASWNEGGRAGLLPPVERRAPVAPETISDVSRSCAPASPRRSCWRRACPA